MEAAREKLVEDNIKLVPHIYYKNQRYFLDYLQYQDDFISAGNMGLVKAANTYDFEKGTKFTSYSGLCILNEMLMLRRKLAKQLRNEINESDTIISGKDDKEVSLMELIPGKDIFQKLEEDNGYNEFYEKLVYIYLNKFTEKQRKVFLFWQEGHKQKEALELLGISQTYLSRIKTKICKIIRENINMRITSTPYAPHKSDYDNFSEYSRDYQRYHYLKSRGRESEFIPFYGINKGKSPAISNLSQVTTSKPADAKVEMGVIDKPNNNLNTIFEVSSDNLDNSSKSFEEVIKLLDDLEKEYISKIKKIRLAKQSLTSVLDLYK